MRSGNLRALPEPLEHCLYRYVLLVLIHHGHPVDGDGDEVLDTGLDVGGHHERSSKSMVSHSFCFDDVCES